eukprot:TRINITY_DN3806_c0_g1_i1.p1 TRINITY_DN3806_c0_g1~~TRINITY_DN3806_c0_g1_i1.p1  ORF type:complete len:343 (+),score=71.44 TRINITY_DN3806_c0_g1_i1:116-1144(+)
MGCMCSSCCGSDSESGRQGLVGAHAATNHDGGITMQRTLSTASSTQKDHGVRDMEQVQREEDKKRDGMLASAQAAAPVVRRHRGFTTRQLQMGWNTVQHALVCGGCGWRIGSVADATMIREDDSNATFMVAMDDGGATICVDYDVCSYAPPEGKRTRRKHVDYTKSRGDLDGTLRAPVAAQVWCRQNNPALLDTRNAVCKNCHCFLGVRVGEKSFLCVRYIRIVDPRTDLPLYPRVPLNCVSCAATLSYADQILCPKRRWSFADNPSENACYVNAVCEENITVTSPSERRLAQGKFIMADVACKHCGHAVGYKFCRDLTREGRNVYQVGRYGLVTSRFRVES